MGPFFAWRVCGAHLCAATFISPSHGAPPSAQQLGQPPAVGCAALSRSGHLVARIDNESRSPHIVLFDLEARQERRLDPPVEREAKAVAATPEARGLIEVAGASVLPARTPPPGLGEG